MLYKYINQGNLDKESLLLMVLFKSLMMIPV